MRLISLVKPIARAPLLAARFVRQELLPELVGMALLCVGYSVVFSITLGEPFVQTFYYSATNTLAFLFVAILMLDLMRRIRLRARPDNHLPNAIGHRCPFPYNSELTT